MSTKSHIFNTSGRAISTSRDGVVYIEKEGSTIPRAS